MCVPCETDCRRGDLDKPIAIRFHEEWGRARVEIVAMLENKSLAQLVEDLDKKNTVLKR